MKEFNEKHEWRVVYNFCDFIFNSYKPVDIEKLRIEVTKFDGDQNPYMDSYGCFTLYSLNDGQFEIELDEDDVEYFSSKFHNVSIKKEDIPEEVLLALSMKWDI